MTNNKCLNSFAQKFRYFLKNIFILLLSIIVASSFAWINYSMHENRLWFSNIEEVEREISFRTECGLYYSFYKQLILNRTYASPYSILKSIPSLTSDHLTEAPRVINIIKRFNIFQEITFAFFYSYLEYSFEFFKSSKLFEYLDTKYLLTPPAPILFYVYLCFSFAGLSVFAIFWLTISVTSTLQKTPDRFYLILKHKEFEWALGILAASWAFANLEDTTRVYFTVNLRENFALPIFWIQNYFVLSSLLHFKVNYMQKIKDIFFIAIFTFLFSALWQFNQFLLFLQSAALFLTYLIYSANNCKAKTFDESNNCHILYNINSNQCYFSNMKSVITRILFAQTLGFLLLIPIQEFQPMLLTSYFVQFNIAIFFVINIISYESIFLFKNRIVRTIVKISFVLLITLFLNVMSKFIFGFQVDDSHIWTFLSGKLRRIHTCITNNNFATGSSYFISELVDLPFESTIYICHYAFAFIDTSFFIRTLKTGILPMYLISIIIVIVKAFKTFFAYNSTNSIKLVKEFNSNEGLKSKPNKKNTKKLSDANKIFNKISTLDKITKNNSESSQNSNLNYLKNELNPLFLFFALQSIASGFFAILMTRMIYLWLPQMIVLAAYSVKFILDKFIQKGKQNVIVIALALVLFAYRGKLFQQEMAYEQVNFIREIKSNIFKKRVKCR